MAPPEDPNAADARLVAAAQDGDVRAIEALLARHEGTVLRVLRFLGVPPRDREDVAQEIFLRVFRHLRGVDRRRPFAGWIYRVTVNAAHDYRRKARESATEERPMGDGFDAPDGSPSPEDLAEDARLRRRLEAALVLLTERERAVFILKEIEGLDTPEIARALGVTRVTVRRHLGLARKRLQGALSEKKSGDR